jgi:hypothetical protein
VQKDEALDAINKFCGEKKYWDKQIISPVSMTTGLGKAIGASDSYPVNGDSDKLWLQWPSPRKVDAKEVLPSLQERMITRS